MRPEDLIWVPSTDRKWLDALKPYFGGGIIPLYRGEDGSVDAVKTVDGLMGLKGWKKIGPNGEDIEP